MLPSSALLRSPVRLPLSRAAVRFCRRSLTAAPSVTDPPAAAKLSLRARSQKQLANFGLVARQLTRAEAAVAPGESLQSPLAVHTAPATRPPLPLRWRSAAAAASNSSQSVCARAGQSGAARSHAHSVGERPCSDHSRYFHLRVYRYDPQSDSEPRMDSYAVASASCGPMLLDVLLAIKDT
ncbi:hypothetical protein MMC34_008717, partial [Xylographa carneopallida]|nr:hypothetical protein [Xylographa carneopallida]